MARHDSDDLSPIADPKSELRQAIDGEDVALVVETIKQRFGFTVTAEYAREFIKFANEVTADVPRK